MAHAEYTNLLTAAMSGDNAGVQRALARGCPAGEHDKSGRTALMMAAVYGRAATVRLLLESGANPDAQDGAGFSALHFAAREAKLEVIDLLVKRGAAIDPQDQWGNTPLFRAVFASKGDGTVIRALLAAGANRHIRNNFGRSPVELANTIANFPVAQHFK